MFAYPIRTAALAVAAIVGLSACTTPYGYSGVSVGVGNAGYYDPYYGGYGYGYGAGYPGYGLGYGFDPYWGWYDGFYYPGSGYYVYDRYRHKHRWTDAQRRYWQLRRERALASSTTSRPVVIRENWNDFPRHRSTARGNRVEGQQQRAVRFDNSGRTQRAERQVTKSQRASRSERQSTRDQRRSEPRDDRGSRGNGRGRESARED
jgi:hypothetical protein